MPTENDALAISAAGFTKCRELEAFMRRTVRPIVEGATPGASLGEHYSGLFYRLLAWMRSLAKLNEPSDFQPVVTASRACFEIALDTTLFREPNAHPMQKFAAWQDSAKLDHAEKVQRYCNETDGQAPRLDEAMFGFIAREGERIRALRARYWRKRDKRKGKNGKPYHPNRWTGGTTESDAKVADRILQDAGFLDFYKRRYPQLCWNIHAGLAGVATVSAEVFPFLAGQSFHECAKWAHLIGENVVGLLGRWDAATEAAFEEGWQNAVISGGLVLKAARARAES